MDWRSQGETNSMKYVSEREHKREVQHATWKMVLCNKADSYLCSCGITEADIVQRGKSVPL